VVVASGVGDGVAENEADDGADDSDEDALGDEDAADLFFLVPSDMRTAMSLVFSMTIMIREMRMLRAATKTIRPMVMKVTTRSRRRARNRGLFCSSSWWP